MEDVEILVATIMAAVLVLIVAFGVYCSWWGRSRRSPRCSKSNSTPTMPATPFGFSQRERLPATE